MSSALVVLSGGMDSTTALYQAWDLYDHVRAVSFSYGQRHSKELHVASKTCVALDVPHYVLNLPQWSSTRSVLTDRDQDVPEGHYAEENMKQTVVPNRNSIMLNIAVGLAMDLKIPRVVTGVHSGDHAIYPDCRPEFIETLNELIHTANEGFNPPVVIAPFMHQTKADIVQIGYQVGVDWSLTWSCYKGGAHHCGRCATCVERLEAFFIAGHDDAVKFEDTDYWRTVIDLG